MNKGNQPQQNQQPPQQLSRPLIHQQPAFIPQQPNNNSSMSYGAPPQYKNGPPPVHHPMQHRNNGSMMQIGPPPQNQYSMPQHNFRPPPPMMMQNQQQGLPSIQPQQTISQYRPVPPSSMSHHNNMHGQMQPQQINHQVTGRTKIQKAVAEPIHQEPKLQNLVSTANLCTDLQLKDIAYKCKNAEYNPRRFAAVIMRMKEPARTTALIFKTGKMVITGAKSETLSKEAAKAYAKAIQKVGYPNVKMTEFKVQNMVGSCSVDFKIKLESLFHSNHQQFCVFNPDTFPGLIYHMAVPKVCLLIFSSGKIVLTGAKQRQDIDQAFKSIIPLLRQFVKKDLRDLDEKKE